MIFKSAVGRHQGSLVKIVQNEKRCVKSAAAEAKLKEAKRLELSIAEFSLPECVMEKLMFAKNSFC